MGSGDEKRLVLKQRRKVTSTKMAAESERSRKLKLVVFGGTGGTGKEVIRQALERGHLVTAVVRTPKKVEKQYVHSLANNFSFREQKQQK